MLELKFTKKEKRIHRFLINLRDISQFQLKSNHRSFSINSLPVRREIQNFNAREFHLFVAGHRRPNDYIHPLRSINHRSILHARRSSDAEKQVPSPQIRDTFARVGYDRLDRTDAARLPLRRFFSRPGRIFVHRFPPLAPSSILRAPRRSSSAESKLPPLNLCHRRFHVPRDAAARPTNFDSFDR